MIQILIVEDHPLVAEGLISIINNTDGLELSGIARSGKEFERLFPGFKSGIVLLDIKLPDTDGIRLCRLIKEKKPDIGVIALTTYNQMYYIEEMLKNGAMGYILKSAEPKEIIEAIFSVNNKKIFVIYENIH